MCTIHLTISIRILNLEPSPSSITRTVWIVRSWDYTLMDGNSTLLSPLSLWKPPCSSLSLWFWLLQAYHITEELNIDCLDVHISLNMISVKWKQISQFSFANFFFLRQALLCSQDCFYTCYVAQAGSELVLILVEAPKYCCYGGILPHPESLASFLCKLPNNTHCIIYFMLLCPLFPFADTWDGYSF